MNAPPRGLRKSGNFSKTAVFPFQASPGRAPFLQCAAGFSEKLASFLAAAGTTCVSSCNFGPLLLNYNRRLGCSLMKPYSGMALRCSRALNGHLMRIFPSQRLLQCAFPLGKGLAALFKAMKFPKPSPGDGALHKRQSGRACAVRMERYAVLSTG